MIAKREDVKRGIAPRLDPFNGASFGGMRTSPTVHLKTSSGVEDYWMKLRISIQYRYQSF
jgi:hypothetical protein